MNLFLNKLLGTKNSLRKHSLFYFLGNILSKGFLVVSMPFLTRMMSPSDFGIITLFDTIYFVLTIIFSFSVEESIKRYYFEEKPNFKEASGSMFSFAFLISTVLLIFILLIKESLSDILNVPVVVVTFAGILAFLALPKGVLLQLLNAQQKSRIYSLITTSSSIINLALTLLFVYLIEEKKYEGRLYGQLFPAVIFFVIALIYCFQNFKLNLKKAHVKYFLNYSLPLIPYKLSGIFLTYVDSVIIAKLLGVTETGLYSIAYRIGMGVLLFHTSVSMALDPKIMVLMQDLEKNEHRINKYIESSAKVLFFFGFVIAVFSKYILLVLVPSDYMDAQNIIPIIILSYCILFIYEQFTRINRFCKKTYINTIAMIISLIVNIILNITLIPIYGYKIAAYTTFISIIVLLIILWINTRYQLRIKKIVNLYRLFIFNLLPICLVFLFTSVFTLENSTIDIFFKISIVLVSGWVLFKNSINSYFKY